MSTEFWEHVWINFWPQFSDALEERLIEDTLWHKVAVVLEDQLELSVLDCIEEYNE